MFEFILVVGGVLIMRPLIKDNMTFLLMSALYGAVLGIVSGLAKGNDR